MASRTETTVLSQDEMREAIELWFRHKFSIPVPSPLGSPSELTVTFNHDTSTSGFGTMERASETFYSATVYRKLESK